MQNLPSSYALENGKKRRSPRTRPLGSPRGIDSPPTRRWGPSNDQMISFSSSASSSFSSTSFSAASFSSDDIQYLRSNNYQKQSPRHLASSNTSFSSDDLNYLRSSNYKKQASRQLVLMEDPMSRPQTPRTVLSLSSSSSSISETPPSPTRTFRRKAMENPYLPNQYNDMSYLSSDNGDLVPFCVTTRVPGNKWRALFLVPIHLVDRLTKYPIVCRGSMFELHQEEIMFGSTSSRTLIAEGSSTVFLKAEFVSPFPEELALEIAQRLTRRIEQAREDYAIDLEQQQQRRWQQRQTSHDQQRRAPIYAKGNYRGRGSNGGHTAVSNILFGF